MLPEYRISNKECNNHVVIQRDVGNSAAGTQLYAKGEFNSFFKMLFVGARVVVFFYLSIAFPVYFT